MDDIWTYATDNVIIASFIWFPEDEVAEVDIHTLPMVDEFNTQRIRHRRDVVCDGVYGEVWRVVWKEVYGEACDEAYDAVYDLLNVNKQTNE